MVKNRVKQVFILLRGNIPCAQVFGMSAIELVDLSCQISWPETAEKQMSYINQSRGTSEHYLPDKLRQMQRK